MARTYDTAERLLLMRDVLELGGTWTIREVQERFGVSENTAKRYLSKLAEMYGLEAEVIEQTNVKVWHWPG